MWALSQKMMGNFGLMKFKKEKEKGGKGIIFSTVNNICFNLKFLFKLHVIFTSLSMLVFFPLSKEFKKQAT